MERPVFARELLNAALENRMLEFWAKNSPDRRMNFVGEEISLLPQHDIRQSRKIIEVLGPSGAGKSTFIQELQKRYSQNSQVIIRTEMTARTKEGNIEDFGGLIKMRGLLAKEFGIKHQMLLWDQAKLIANLSGITELIQLSPPATLIIERGANDILAMNPFEIPEHYSIRYDETHRNQWLKNIFETMSLAEMTDATILFGTDWRTTRKRRIDGGQKANGWLVNKKNWPSIIEGYERWLGSYWPIWRERQGTGLLIVDGRNNSDRNNSIAMEYCRKIIEVD